MQAAHLEETSVENKEGGWAGRGLTPACYSGTRALFFPETWRRDDSNEAVRAEHARLTKLAKQKKSDSTAEVAKRERSGICAVSCGDKPRTGEIL